MSETEDTTQPLLPNYYYHFYNRGNNKQLIFFQEKNHAYFLKKYSEYMDRYVDTYAYCLLSNHFHLLIKIKSVSIILENALEDFQLITENTWRQWDIEIDGFVFPRKQKVKLITILEMDLGKDSLIRIASWFVSERARRWLMGYSKAINKQEDRTGSLFQKKFKRKKASDMGYLKYLVWYIHNNPVHHNIFHALQEYPHSSYQTFVKNWTTKLKRDEVFEWYGGLAAFIEYHKTMTLGYDGNDVKYWME